MIFRKISKKIEYKLLNGNKILIVDGARQVGKTFIIRVVGNSLFKHFIEINLLNDFNSNKEFEKVKTIQDFYLQISSIFGKELGNKDDTLIFLDEIQVYPHLITMLKFLKDDNKYNFICSGSELGITLNKTSSIPMGYIEILKMYPIDFEEFLFANGVGDDVISHMKECFMQNKSLSEPLHIRIMDLFKKYLLIGGLPDAVNNFIKNNNIQYVRDIHNEIYNFYKEDASKYDKENKLKIMKIYDLIPSALCNKKKRIVIKDIEGIKGKSKKNYQNEFDYLIHSGIALNVDAIANPVFPLIQSQDKNLIKLYLSDVGLLSNIYYKNNIRAILDDNISMNLGTLYENVVAMELICHGHKLYYYDNKKNGEIDYLLDDYENSSVIPIEVKSGKDYKVHSALNEYLNSGRYNARKGYVLNNNWQIDIKEKIIYMPIYYAMFF
ncbi:MAG: ATP-binding protein [Lachnospiraceae bacterium]|nr:ATP-binding protein [Lachnospiraceae bacterium]